MSSEGHRKRLRSKFVSSGFVGFHDYEIIELLLTLGVPRKDCKLLAKELIKKYGSVSGIIYAGDQELKSIKGLGESSIFGIKLAREISLYMGNEELLSVSNNTSFIEVLAQQLVKEIGYDKKESFKVVCLNTKGGVVSEVVSVGSLNASVVHPREVFKVAIENSSASIVVAHNHPSGDTNPSEDDILTTRRIVESGKIIGIDVVDHIIVSRTGYTSLSKMGFL